MKRKLEPGIKAEWLAALRGGEYKQGHRRLCLVSSEGHKSYCCLGVLADLLIKRGNEKFAWGEVRGFNEKSFELIAKNTTFADGTYASHSMLPMVYDEGRDPTLFALSEHDSVGCPTMGRLADMNDKGKTFAEIADWIEQEL